MNKQKTILVCPLDWGLGHASRDSYLIRQLLQNNYTVKLAGEGPSLEFLRSEFPNLEFIFFPSFRIQFSRTYPAWLKIVFALPAIAAGFVREHRKLKKIIRQHHIDIVISDTRYGLWNRGITSILISHQIKFSLPVIFKVFEYPVYLINIFLMKRFALCWIPDFPGQNNLSGDLTHKFSPPGNASFIGILSRFKDLPEQWPDTDLYELAAFVSGPEPQRTIFENILTDQIIHNNKKSIIFTGQPGINKLERFTGNCIKVSHLPTQQLANIILTTKYIICRSGYSSIMDLVAMNRKALLVPTPGQTEQEYLAVYLYSRGIFPYMIQKEFNLDKAMHILDIFNSKQTFLSRDYLSSKLSVLNQ